MALLEFKNEAEFRTKWVAPFLSKMGYLLPKHVHGTNEQGKDFYFAEHDKFGHLKFHAAQVKLGKIGAGQVELDNLLNQVRRSFTVTLKHHKGADRQRISSVYLMTNESISDRAREYISDYCRMEHFGENVFYLDGETLENLDRHATIVDDKNLRNRLSALMYEIDYNLLMLKDLMDKLTNNKRVYDTCRTLVLEDTLRNPLPEDILSYKYISFYWMSFNTIKNLIIPRQGDMNPESLKLFEILKEFIDVTSVKIKDAVTTAIDKVDARYNLRLEIEPEED